MYTIPEENGFIDGKCIRYEGFIDGKCIRYQKRMCNSYYNDGWSFAKTHRKCIRRHLLESKAVMYTVLP